jgi:ubiquinone/menaquinone biosynthesis C-methylase UbiE
MEYQPLGSRSSRLNSDSLILDFGCGDGSRVHEYRAAALKALGVDVTLVQETDFLQLIAMNPYRIPFDDDTFDFVFSKSGLEHVEDLDSALSEIYRVLKTQRREPAHTPRPRETDRASCLCATGRDAAKSPLVDFLGAPRDQKLVSEASELLGSCAMEL